jgi:hypothetical protein
MNNFESLNPEIQEHLRQLAKASGLSAAEDGYERLAAAWLEKKALFEKSAQENKLSELAFFASQERREPWCSPIRAPCLKIGPLMNGTRCCEYSSIGLRSDVPPSAIEEASQLASDIEVDDIVQFSKGPIKSSSQVYTMAVASEELEPEEEEALLTQLGQNLVEDFVEVNKTVLNDRMGGRSMMPRDAMLKAFLREGPPSAGEYSALIEAATAALRSEAPDRRPATIGGRPGGLIMLDKELPVIIVPDLHARRGFFISLMESRQPGGGTVMEALNGAACRYCALATAFTRKPGHWRWKAAYAEYAGFFREHAAMDQEMAESMGLMEMVMLAKISFPRLLPLS